MRLVEYRHLSSLSDSMSYCQTRPVPTSQWKFLSTSSAMGSPRCAVRYAWESRSDTPGGTIISKKVSRALLGLTWRSTLGTARRLSLMASHLLPTDSIAGRHRRHNQAGACPCCGRTVDKGISRSSFLVYTMQSQFTFWQYETTCPGEICACSVCLQVQRGLPTTRLPL